MKKLDWISTRGGMVLVNIHPDYIDFDSTGEVNHAYGLSHVSELLDHLETHYAGRSWNPLPAELARWYQKQQGSRHQTFFIQNQNTNQ